MRLTRHQVEQDERLWPLIQFMMSSQRDISNWKYIQRLNYVLKESIKLYRGINCKVHEIKIQTDRCTSWSTDQSVAKSCGTVILTCIFSPDYMIFDTRFLDPDILSKHRWQKEIIIKPITEELVMTIETHEYPEMVLDPF